MSTTNKIKKSGFWQMVEVAGIAFSQLAYLAIMSRLLDKSDFGMMAIINSLLAFGSVLSEAGMGASLIQKKDMTAHHKTAALQGSVLIGIVFSAIYFFFAGLISSFFEMPNMVLMIKVLAIGNFLSSVSNVSIALLHKNFRFKQSSIITVLSTVLSYAVGVVLAYQGFGVWSLVYATLLMTLLKTIGYFYLAPVKWENKIYRNEWRELFSFGSGILLLRFTSYLGSNGINLILGKIFTPELLGAFERSNRIKSIPTVYLGRVMDKVMFPVMSEIQDEKDRLFKIYNAGLGISNIVMMPVSAVLIFFTKEIVFLLLGKEWSETIIPLQIMFLILPMSISSRMADSAVRSTGRIYLNVKRKYTYILTLFLATGIGGYYYGLIGAAVGSSLSYLVNYILMIFLVKSIFSRTFKEIFVDPLLEASIYSAIIVLMLYLFKILLGLFISNEILLAAVDLGIVSAILAAVVWFYPQLLGYYGKVLKGALFKKQKKNKKNVKA